MLTLCAMIARLVFTLSGKVLKIRFCMMASILR